VKIEKIFKGKKKIIKKIAMPQNKRNHIGSQKRARKWIAQK